jgi:nitrite reductase/ring-hydroxylating ferredoxin subunit
MPEVRWHRVGRLDDLPEGRGVLVDDRAAVFRCGTEVFAVADECPHRGESLAAGVVSDCAVTCPGHWWRFDVRTGTLFGAPEIIVTRYETTVENGTVAVALPDRGPVRSWRDILLEPTRSLDRVEDTEES